LLEGKSARKYASRGQLRTIIIALKLAELEAASRNGNAPLFLLDDLSSELDRERTQKLVRLLAERDNQVWITTTEPSHLSSLPMSQVSRWKVQKGTVILK